LAVMAIRVVESRSRVMARFFAALEAARRVGIGEASRG